MASKKTLNATNLEALGAPRLAELLIEISAGDAAAKRRLRLELAAAAGSTEVAREIRKRLRTIDWQNRKDFINDLETQQRAIIDVVADNNPAVALDLLWQYLALANSVMERCEDRSGTVIGLFHDACDNLGTIAKSGRLGPQFRFFVSELLSSLASVSSLATAGRVRPFARPVAL